MWKIVFFNKIDPMIKVCNKLQEKKTRCLWFIQEQHRSNSLQNLYYLVPHVIVVPHRRLYGARHGRDGGRHPQLLPPHRVHRRSVTVRALCRRTRGSSAGDGNLSGRCSSRGKQRERDMATSVINILVCAILYEPDVNFRGDNNFFIPFI